MDTLQEKANSMINHIIAENMPEKAVINALKNRQFNKKNIYLVAIGKAAWTMAKAATDYLGDRIVKGIVITKYDHSMGDIKALDIYEAGHPIPDEATVFATQKVLDLIENLTSEDDVLFLVSGGGSALFEAPVPGVSLDELSQLTQQMLASGADIVEMNMIRKRLSKVKAGRFAQRCAPASIFAIVLSDVLGDRLDSIASGPAAPDISTTKEAMAVVKKYHLALTDVQKKYLQIETPKQLDNVESIITGSVTSLCESAFKSAQNLGFTPYVLTTTLNIQAKEAGRFLAAIASDTKKGITGFKPPCAIIAGGETVVKIVGEGKGGRNQELALAAASGIKDLDGVLLFSLASDGTDGPTDAAGGMVDGKTEAQLKNHNQNIDDILDNNDAYHGLQAVGGLIMTGPTGTNVNDVTVILCDEEKT